MEYYRIEEYAVGITNIKDIINFEIKELKNLDIPDYLGIKLDSEVDQRIFENADTADDLSEKIIDEIIEKLFDIIGDYPYGLWLSNDIKKVKMMYGSQEQKNCIFVYNIDETKVKILSNLGSDGILFASKEELIPSKEIYM